MNKVKMFFIAAALVLTTAGVFAGKAKFVTGTLYAWDGGSNYYQLTPSVSLTNLATGTGTAATITSSNGNPAYGLYSFTAPSTYSVLHTVNF